VSTSNSYLFNPSLGELTLYAFNLCGIRPTALLQEHMQSARMAANLLLGRWSSQGVNLWAVDLQTVPLVQGTTSYSVPPETIVILDAYITVGAGSTAYNRLILPISRSEYASYAQPEQQGAPTTYWFDRLLSPSITLWPVPDGSETSLSYYRLRQIQDANFTSGQNVEIPYYALEAFATGLACRLAAIWAPDKAVALKAMADEAYNIFADQNVETSSVYLTPQLGSYFRP
jgi:hypothetical protein